VVPAGSPSSAAPARSGVGLWIAAAVVVVAVVAVGGWKLFDDDAPGPLPRPPIVVPDAPKPPPDGPGPPKPEPPKPEPPRPESPKTGPDPAEARRAAEAARQAEEKRRAEARQRLDAAAALAAKGRLDEALAKYAELRADADVGEEACRRCDATVQAILDAAEAARVAGDPEAAEAKLAGLVRAANAAAAGGGRPPEGYDAALVQARIDALRKEQSALVAARTEIDHGHRQREAGNLRESLPSYRKALRHPMTRDEAARGVSDALRAAAARGRKRDEDGDVRGAIDDFQFVLDERASAPADGSIDLAAVTLDLAEARVAAKEVAGAEAALASLPSEARSSPRAVALRLLLLLSKDGGAAIPPADRDAVAKFPTEVQGDLVARLVRRSESALAREEYDLTIAFSRVAALVSLTSPKPDFLWGKACALRARGSTRIANDVTTARVHLANFVKTVDRQPDPSQELRKLKTEAQQLLSGLPEK
jgi:hypothetical protein